MRKILVAISVAFSLLGSVLAFASGGGNVVGNGGDALVCKNGRVIFFDIYEAQKGRGLTIDMGPAPAALDKVEYVINRIPDSLSNWKSVLRTGVNEFYGRSRIDDFELEDVKDTDNIIKMPDCELEQAVIQKTPVLDTDPIYFVNKSLWARMDNDSKASLILHEVIYRQAIRAGHENSVGTRALNSYLMADKTPQEATCFYTRALQTLKMKHLIPLIYFDNVVIDGINSVVDSQCLASQVKIVSGAFNVEGVQIAPITNTNEEFPSEWGVDFFNISNPGRAHWIHFDSQYPMQIGSHRVLLAPYRTAEEWGATKNWTHGLTPDSGVPLRRPGYVSLSNEGEVLAAAVEVMQAHVMGQQIFIKGDVWFAPKTREILRVDFARTGTMKLNGEFIEIEGFEFLNDQDRYIVRLSGNRHIIVNPDGSLTTSPAPQE